MWWLTHLLWNSQWSVCCLVRSKPIKCDWGKGYSPKLASYPRPLSASQCCTSKTWFANSHAYKICERVIILHVSSATRPHRYMAQQAHMRQFLLDEHKNVSKPRWKLKSKTKGLLDDTEWHINPLQTVQTKHLRIRFNLSLSELLTLSNAQKTETPFT